MRIARPASMLDGFSRAPTVGAPSAAADHVRTCDQPQDREGARPHRAGQATRYRRRVDRVAAFLMQCECPVMADIVAKSKIERPKKSRESRFQGFSAAASLFKATTEVRGRFCVKRCGPSYRRVRNASAALNDFGRHPKKTFAIKSALFGSGRPSSDS